MKAAEVKFNVWFKAFFFIMFPPLLSSFQPIKFSGTLRFGVRCRIYNRRGLSIPFKRSSSTTSPLYSTSLSDWEKAAALGKTLVIVESPAKAKTIQSYLDPSLYIVDYSAGHVRDLPLKAKDSPPEYKKIEVLPAIKLYAGHLGVDVFNGFQPIYVPLPNKQEILARLKANAASCARILLASDEDREGEAIAWHLIEILKPQIPLKRAVFHEITKQAILNSFATPRYSLVFFLMVINSIVASLQR